MNEVCKPCPNVNGCKIHEPKVAKWGYEPDTWDGCAFFSCLAALRHAGKEMNSGKQFQTYSLPDGSKILALSFETPDKETKFSSPIKVVSTEGIIYGETEDGFKETGQKTFRQ